ncbi:MAG: response regulator, partial [Cyanobacteria bacterium J06632_3]
MRAAHSIKGAARIVQVDSIVRVSHALEDFFVAAKQDILPLNSDRIDVLLLACDFISRLSLLEESALIQQPDPYEVDANTIVTSIENLVASAVNAQPKMSTTPALELTDLAEAISETESRAEIGHETCLNGDSEIVSQADAGADANSTSVVSSALLDERTTPRPLPAESNATRMVRMSADNLNRLMGLAGESLVEANWLQPFSMSLLRLKRQQQSVLLLMQRMEQAAETAGAASTPDCSSGMARQDHRSELHKAIQSMQSCHDFLSEHLSELDLFSCRFSQLSDRLYREVIASHMCSFETGSRGYGRLLRDLAKHLGKQVSLEVVGATTQVDRDILEKLDAPITHLLTNAVVHGIESPDVRISRGKSPGGKILIEVVHRSGMLMIAVEDDGGGIDFQRLRHKIVQKGMSPMEVVENLSESELIEFLFLPGFSTASQVDKVAGRGYGLDIARNMVKSVGGGLEATSVDLKGTRFQFQLPLTLSVVRSLLLEIDGEPYAMSLSQMGRVLRLRPDQICYSENKPYLSIETTTETTTSRENISIVSARRLLGLAEPAEPAEELWVVVVGEPGNQYGIWVDRLLEEKDLVVRPLDERLGKVPHVSSAALTEKGEPILILDMADLLQSAAKIAAGENTLFSQQHSTCLQQGTDEKAVYPLRTAHPAQKRILVVDDSMTVRAMEKKLLQNKGYAVDMAVNGAEGWNALRMNNYDLVITDIDMPRMTGIELIQRMRGYGPTQTLPVIVVSYKDREADQMAGLNAGANYYLTKSSFHNDGLITAVVDLIGVPS